jgi:UDP-N-acetylglucosamine diphosphorylase/glucosamine-1-phosphate N-acetyltransferase
MNCILFDDQSWNNLLPLTFTRPVCEIRVGILTIKEKWNKVLETECSHLTQKYLAKKFPIHVHDDNILINGSILPNKELLEEINNLKVKEALLHGEKLVAIRLSRREIEDLPFSKIENFFYAQQDYEIINATATLQDINFPWEIFKKNGDQINADLEILKLNMEFQEVSETNRVFSKENIYIEEGAKVEMATLNAETGPIYIGKDALIMEGAIIRGPFVLCNDSVVKMGAKIYGPTTIGPHSKVGGEINNVVFFGFSNKAHDGFLGNAVIGEWCNLGADTNNSNLKNNYAEVKVWNYSKERFVKTGLQFCGLIMGDHSKCGINTMFNTGTVIGVSANIFGAGFPRNFVPSFSWGGPHGFTEYSLNKAFQVAELVMDRRGLKFDNVEQDIFKSILDLTEKYRKF